MDDSRARIGVDLPILYIYICIEIAHHFQNYFFWDCRISIPLYFLGQPLRFYASQADWGPVFVYGPMLLPAVWGELIGRVPEMAPGR